MEVYTYSEARQKLASVLDKAAVHGSVMIRRKDGQVFTVMPVTSKTSPLDVPSINADISAKELVEIVRGGRDRVRGIDF